MIHWPDNTKDIIDRIREAIGRPITFFVPVYEDVCPACDQDPLTGKSTNPFCPVCFGSGYQTTWVETSVLAHVRWGKAEGSLLYPGAKIVTGDCAATIEFSEENVALVETAKYVIVDGKTLYIDSYDLRGVQPINRIVLNLVQNPRNKK